MRLLPARHRQGGRVISPVDTLVARRSGGCVRPDSDALRRWQVERCAAAVEYARDRSRFYRSHLGNVDVLSIRSPEDVERLPFTTPAQVARDPLGFLCIPQSAVSRVTTVATSGTTAARKRVFFSNTDLLRTVDFFEHGMSAIAAPGQEVLILLSGATENGLGALLRTALERLWATARFPGPMWEYQDALTAARCADCIVGTPADVLWMCRTDPSLRPASVLLSADYAPRSVIRAVANAWQCRVFTHYGLTETGFGCAVQCAALDAHHVRHADLLIEVVDPRTGELCPPGSPGRSS